MSVGYTWIQWNRHKRVYDVVLVVGIVLYLAAFLVAAKSRWTGAHAISDAILLIRASCTLALIMLHVVLCIGPLARLDRRFLPLLYNRRHLGVATFLVALVHGVLVLGFYHGFGTVNPIVSVLTGNTNYQSVTAFPFETLGAIALVILFFMASTSHDFWNRNLGPGAWKALHMLVYVAYVLIILHVVLGFLQKERSGLYVVLLALGVVTVVTLHVVAGVREARRDRAGAGIDAEAGSEAGASWIDVGGVDEIEDMRSKVVCLRGRERVAVFRYGGRISAVTNVCRHQGGPLGEGRIVDGCITCPWHGWQYRPGDGQSPPPFEERIETYEVRVREGRVALNPEAKAPGTAVTPATIEAAAEAGDADEFYVGFLKVPPRQRRFVAAAVPALLAATVVVGASVALVQADPGPAVWEIGRPVQVQGVVRDRPYAMLVTDGQGGRGAVETILLVGSGKFGAVEQVREHAGRSVVVTGTPLTRNGMRMLELAPEPGAVVATDGGGSAPAPRALGRRTLAGEIIDPKCYFGAMKPAEGKTHKACAVLCIRGGIPPMFVTRDGAGGRTYYLLTTADGGPAHDLVLPWVGEPVEIIGAVEQADGLLMCRLDAGAIRRR